MSRAFCWGQKTQLPIRAPFSSSNLCSSAHLVPHCMILSLLASLSPPWQRQPRTSRNRNQGGRPWSWGEDDLIHVLHCQPWLSITWSKYLGYWKSESTQKTIWLKHIWNIATAKKATLQCVSLFRFVIPLRSLSFWFEYGQPNQVQTGRISKSIYTPPWWYKTSNEQWVWYAHAFLDTAHLLEWLNQGVN